MERRAYATIKKVWPEVEVIVTSPQLSFEEYLTEEFTKDYVINIMVGDLQRKGIQTLLALRLLRQSSGQVRSGL